jgi:methionyl-tRNA formyltransferase
MMNTGYVVCCGEPWADKVLAAVAARREGVRGRQSEKWIRVGPGPLPSVAQLQEWNARCLFFLHWHDHVPVNLTGTFECVNFHCTPLPYGRGGSPIENMLLRGHSETVMTAHRMTEEVDAGPVYARRGPVSLAGSRADILARFVSPCAELVEQIVTTRQVPEDQAVAARFERLSPAEFEAFWKSRTVESRA